MQERTYWNQKNFKLIKVGNLKFFWLIVLDEDVCLKIWLHTLLSSERIPKLITASQQSGIKVCVGHKVSLMSEIASLLSLFFSLSVSMNSWIDFKPLHIIIVQHRQEGYQCIAHTKCQMSKHIKLILTLPCVSSGHFFYRHYVYLILPGLAITSEI